MGDFLLNQKAFNKNHIIINQMKIKTIATHHFFFNEKGVSAALILLSSITLSGINFIESVINKGTIIKSSRYPNTGIKSGIRSMGLNK